ncbi:MAG: adenylate/guanylate cyclase domain-containing protein [Spirochaetales bacterium]|nr:adenylate/guanylate cyclase domain-containing protein [Spirochaetales bacterium]
MCDTSATLHQSQEGKSLKISSAIALFGLGASLLSVIASLLARSELSDAGALFYPLVNATGVLTYLAGWFLLRQGFSLLPRLLILTEAQIQITAVVFAGGIMNATALYYFAGVAIPFLVFTAREYLYRIPFILSSVLLFLLAGYIFIVRGDPPFLPGIRGDSFAYFQLMNATFAFTLLALCVYHFYRQSYLAEAGLALERTRSERLLLNILPASIADRLKSEDKPIADRFDEVTVLFADLVGFTALSERFAPEEVVDMLNHLFSHFDTLADELGLEKIKTIGDAYMAVGGLPHPVPDHALQVARMGIGMLGLISDWNQRRGHALQLRIGIHSGPVVAGVIGLRKFSYDLWGDTVNLASRLESHGVPGRIHLSPATAKKISSLYRLESRGTVSIKGKGDLETFLLANEQVN